MAAEATTTLANRTPVKTKEALDALLADRGGKRYYKELDRLDVDRDALKKKAHRGSEWVKTDLRTA